MTKLDLLQLTQKDPEGMKDVLHIVHFVREEI